VKYTGSNVLHIEAGLCFLLNHWIVLFQIWWGFVFGQPLKCSFSCPLKIFPVRFLLLLNHTKYTWAYTNIIRIIYNGAIESGTNSKYFSYFYFGQTSGYGVF